VPVVERSNNKILPANARATDVASKAIVEITPVQQRRYFDAFVVQGIAAVHYARLTQGRKCSCQASAKILNGILDKEGKASAGAINAMLTGDSAFSVTAYNLDQQRVTGSNQASPLAPVNKNQGVFDIVTDGEEIPFADLLAGRPAAFGDNGPVHAETIDDMVNDFDASSFGFSDVACPICFGTGYVGGYEPYHAHREVLTVTDVQPAAGSQIIVTERPFGCVGTGFSAVVKFPRGAIGIDAFRVWNGTEIQNAMFAVDGVQLTNNGQLLAACDGKQHVLTVTGLTGFTHFEMQFVTTTESIYFEFPRRPNSANTGLLEQMDPFDIILSPNVPTIDSQDIIVEQQLGKTLIVQNVNPWNTRMRDVLGWEAQVRVIQPMELYRLLPGRGRVMSKSRTAELVRDNVTGPRRT
jgi:hypothetical protein